MFEDPTKVFPCDCMGEGIAVTKDYWEDDASEGEVAVSAMEDLNDCSESPYIQLSFWECVSKNSDHRLTRWDRIKYAWHILRGRSPWEDMVIMKADHARSFANHILYVITKGEREKKLGEPIVKEPLE